MILERSFENEDYFAVGYSIPKYTKIEIDLPSLMKTEFLSDKESEIVDQGVSAEEYLYLSRRRAETKLIKSKILHKLHYSTKLTENEENYKKQWMQDLKEKKTIISAKDSLLPSKPSALKVLNLSATDLYSLNSISNVNFCPETHKDHAVNDIILELAHFLDADTIEKVELEIAGEALKRQFALSPDFKFAEAKNKEVSIVLNYLEEQAWRRAGAFSTEEVETIKQMFSIGRNDSHFDRQFYANDMQSFEDLMTKINPYDNRQAMLDQWLRRKEYEINERVNLPHEKFKKTDDELGAKLRAQVKKARECLVAKLLTHD